MERDIEGLTKAQITKAAAAIKAVSDVSDEQAIAFAKAAMLSTVEPGRCSCVGGGGRYNNMTAPRYRLTECICGIKECRDIHEAFCERNNKALEREGYKLW